MLTLIEDGSPGLINVAGPGTAGPLSLDEPVAERLTLVDVDLGPSMAVPVMGKGAVALFAACAAALAAMVGVEGVQYQSKQSALAALADAGVDADERGLLLALSQGRGQLLAPFQALGFTVAQTPRAIEAAITSGSAEMLDVVLAGGAKLDREPKRGELIRLAIDASIAGDAGLLVAVLKLAPEGGSPDARVISHAASSGKWAAFEVLAKDPAFHRHRDDEGNTVVHLATLADAGELIKTLQAVAGIDLAALNRRKQSALHVAVGQDKPLAARALVQAGLDPLAADSQGTAAIALALNAGMDSVVAKMLARSKAAHGFVIGADPARAFSGGMSATARALVLGGLQLDSPMPSGVTPLAAALMGQPADIDLVGWILDQDADPNAPSTVDGVDSITPLMVAVATNNEAAVKLLRAKGASVDLTASNGASAKLIADRRGLLRMRELLD